nr:reverse transcriptase domain-containing protein [Tanacetum cinerariifolium]
GLLLVTLSRSSVEAEYHGVANVVAKTAWVRNFLLELHAPLSTATIVHYDNVSGVYLSTNPVWHQRIKHIEIDIHFVRDYFAFGQLADRSITSPVGIAEDVYVKVGSFHFSADFVVVGFDADPRVPLILGRSFLKTRKALIDVFEGELTLRVGKEAITFNLDQTSRYSANYNDMTAKRIDVIDMACEEYSQEVLGFSDTISSGNPTSDFLLEEVDAFLAVEDEPTSSGYYQTYLDPEGDILLLEAFLNDDPSPPPYQGNYMPEVRKELIICEAHSKKSSVDEPHVAELKELPPHLEYAFLEGDDKLPVIIAKYLSVEEKTALITILKSHKRAIAWKLSKIKGINPEFCTYKILMEEDFEPAVQHQRRVNPKIHDVIKQEVIKLLEAGLIYPISDSPWVSPVHCIPKKGGFTVVENEDNELIPTRLVMGWRVCIDYRKLNEATRKDHFPLPFMNQMLERLAGNQHYCFLNGKGCRGRVVFGGKNGLGTVWVSCRFRVLADLVLKKGGFTAVENEDNELIPTRLVTGWRVCIDYRKLDEATRKDHFPLPFMDHMLERIAGNQFYCFLEGFFGYFQIPIDPKDQEKTTFTCPYGTFAYRRMPFGLCNAPCTFQRCMMAIFHDMIEKTMEVFMDDFSVFGNSFQSCLSHLYQMLKRCEDTNLCLNWEKSHFMVKEDSLNVAAGGNLLSKTTREAFQIIENKSKVHYSRNKLNVSMMNMTSRENASKTDDRIDKLADQISTLVDNFAKKVVTPAPVKAVEESRVTCGGNHAYYNCPNTDSNQLSVCVATGTYNQVAPQNRASNFMAPPGFASNQASTSGTLPSNTIPNPKGEMKAITTRSGVAYEGPSIHTPKKSLLTNKDKLFELAKILLYENCLAMLLKKLPEKLIDPGKFLIPCDFSGMDVCHALAYLGASINFMPLSIWKNLSLPELTPTRMTLELADQSITRSKGFAEDVFVKVGKFRFLTDFVVVDFEVDPRVPLILGRFFFRTSRALIDVYGEEITIRVNDEAVTFNLNQTTRYSFTYDDLSVNRINIIDVAREEYAQKILGFSNNSSGGNLTSTFEPVLFYSPSLTPFEGSDFILEEIDAYLKDESISPEIDHTDYDLEGDICLIKKLLNNDPFQLPLMDLKQGEIVKVKSLIEESLELELKDLPSHLEYAYLEGADKLPVIIAKDLKVDEKKALLKVLKSHKRAIAWKITDIKGIDPRFCTHKILMEENALWSLQCSWDISKVYDGNFP